MKEKAVFVLAGIGVAAFLFGGGYFTGRKTCPQIVQPIPSAQIPEVKPAQTKEPLPPKPVIKWKTETVLDTAALSQFEKAAFVKGREVGFSNGWDSCARAHHAYLKPERFTVTDTVPHRKDSIIFFPLADTFSVVHSGIIPTILVAGEQSNGKKRRSLLHIGLMAWFGKSAEFWGTIPLPREKRTFYFPHRGGVNYQPKGKEWKLVFEWQAL